MTVTGFGDAAADQDERLIERLRAIALEADPPPELVTAAAEAALLTRRLDAELAMLVADSGDELPQLARGEGGGGGGGEQVRMLTFESASVVIELEIRSVGRSLSLRGLVSGAVGEVTVETGDVGSHAGEAGMVRRTMAVNADGWFTMDGLAPGVLRVHVPTGSGAVTTSWVTF